MRRFFSLLVLLLSSTAISEPILTEDLHWYSIGTMTLSIESAEGNQVVGTLKLPEQNIALTGTLEDHVLEVENADTTMRMWGWLTDDDKQIIQIQGYLTHEEDQIRINGNGHPMADGKVTCEEKERYPIFTVKEYKYYARRVEYEDNCELDLMTQDFFKDLFSLGSKIRGHMCMNWRLGRSARVDLNNKIEKLGYLARHSFTTIDYLPIGEELSNLYQHSSFSAHARRGHSSWSHFTKWSYESPYNKALYDEYKLESDKVWLELTAWFIRKKGLSLPDAKRSANWVFYLLDDYFFGFYSKRNHDPDTPYNKMLDQLQRNVTSGGYLSNHDFWPLYSKASHEEQIDILNKIIGHPQAFHEADDALRLIKNTSVPQHVETPLSNATIHPAILTALIEKGFGINHKNHFGKTPLYYAIQYNQPDSVQILLNHHAVVNDIYQVDGYDPVKDYKTYASWNCYKNPDLGEVDIRHWFRTPLMHAAQHSDVEMLKLLIEHGADPMMRDSTDETAYDYAVRTGNPENAAYLRSIMPASAFPESTTTTTAN